MTVKHEPDTFLATEMKVHVVRKLSVFILSIIAIKVLMLIVCALSKIFELVDLMQAETTPSLLQR
jgi:hypothetical protein